MTNRIVIGFYDNEYRFRMSRPGFDVLNTNLNAEQLAFDSKWDDSLMLLTEGIAYFNGNIASVILSEVPNGVRPIISWIYRLADGTLTSGDDYAAQDTGLGTYSFETKRFAAVRDSGNLNVVAIRYIVMVNRYG